MATPSVFKFSSGVSSDFIGLCARSLVFGSASYELPIGLVSFEWQRGPSLQFLP